MAVLKNVENKIKLVMIVSCLFPDFVTQKIRIL